MSHVDSTSPVTHVSLCAGYGGIDLGLRRVLPTLRTIAYSEREGFCCANLVSKVEAGLMDAAPIWTDVKTFPWAEFHGRVDILSGGYPCQPFSAAGKRLGAEDPRHLWPYISAGIAAMRPSACFFENVEGHISLGLPDVIEDLGRLGYRTTWGVASASECGAPHQRKRVFILAERQQQGLEGRASQQGYARGLQRKTGRGGDFVWPSRPNERQHEWEPPRVVMDDSKGLRSAEPADGIGQAAPWADASGDETVADAKSPVWRRSSNEDNGWRRTAEAGRPNGSKGDRQTQSSLGRDADGLTHRLDHAELHVSTDNRTDELRLLGNGVVPATAERAFRVLVGELMEATT